MLRESRPTWLRYAVALLVTAAGFSATVALQPWITPFQLPLAAVLVSVWYGGRGPGILAAALSALLIAWFLLPPRSSPAVGDPQQLWRLGLFVVVSALIIIVTEVLRDARRQAEENAREAQRHREALRESHAQIVEILSSITDCYYALDRDWRYSYVNPQAEAYLGRPREELIGKCIWEVYPQAAGSVFEQEFRRAVTEQVPVHLEAPSAVFDRWAEVHAYPSAHGLSVYFRDISDRKQLEQELRRRAEELAAADRRKDEFLAMLAHELRNPLAPMLHAVELLQRLGQPEPRAAQAQQAIERQVRHLARLTDDLLDVSRITRGKIRLRRERLDLARLVRETVEDRRGGLEAAHLELDLSLPAHPVWVEGDATRLAQVVGNLLQNAVKFTDPGGRVTVGVRIAECGVRSGQNGEGSSTPDAVTRSTGNAAFLSDAGHSALCTLHSALLTVRDTGMGIDPEMLPVLFETFAQADRTLDRSRGGLGLGLALVKGLVELHGGEVRAASAGVGGGAEFTVALPLAREPQAAVPEPAPRTGPALSLRILVVEDNRDAAEPLRYLLELSGCTVEVAYSGPAALEAARRFGPEVVLCDIGLPRMDGYAVAAALRRDPATAGARLIALSGYGHDDAQQRSQEAGFDRHLTKPIAFAELQHILWELTQPCER